MSGAGEVLDIQPNSNYNQVIELKGFRNVKDDSVPDEVDDTPDPSKAKVATTELDMSKAIIVSILPKAIKSKTLNNKASSTA